MGKLIIFSLKVEHKRHLFQTIKMKESKEFSFFIINFNFPFIHLSLAWASTLFPELIFLLFYYLITIILCFTFNSFAEDIKNYITPGLDNTRLFYSISRSV